MRISVLTDQNQAITSYGVCLSTDHNPLPNGIIVDTDIDIETIVGNYTLQNGILVIIPDIGLRDAKQAKIIEVTQAYQTELNGTFPSSAIGNVLVYDYSLESQTLWKELRDTIGKTVDGGDLPDSVLFPNGEMSITLADNTKVPHTRDQLQQVLQEIVSRKLSLYQKLQDMITVGGRILSAGTIDEVNLISW